MKMTTTGAFMFVDEQGTSPELNYAGEGQQQMEYMVGSGNAIGIEVDSIVKIDLFRFCIKIIPKQQERVFIFSFVSNCLFFCFFSCITLSTDSSTNRNYLPIYYPLLQGIAALKQIRHRNYWRLNYPSTREMEKENCSKDC